MEDSLLSDNPLIKTLPPATDYLNYLILVEHHLTKKQLPIFHNILQDIQLTANIGWDLVHLLLPLLPESEQCLQDVARLGNPREVVLKVTELLGDIEEEEECNDEELGDLKNVSSTGNQGRPDQDHLPSEEVENVTTDLPNLNSRSQVYCILRYINLVHMLAILHPRIKTKYPSRFLSTSLQAVLPAFSYVAQYSIATEATLDLIKALSPNPRPRLPPRKSSSQVPTVASVPASAPDPEAQDASMGPEEEALQRRLVQAFLTFVVEGYVSSIKACEDIPGLAWSCRYYEKIHPERAVPGRLTYLDMFVSEEEKLHSLDTVLGQCLVSNRWILLVPTVDLCQLGHFS